LVKVVVVGVLAQPGLEFLVSLEEEFKASVTT